MVQKNVNKHYTLECCSMIKPIVQLKFYDSDNGHRSSDLGHACAECKGNSTQKCEASDPAEHGMMTDVGS